MKKESPLKRLWNLAENEHKELRLAILFAIIGVIGGIIPFISAGKIIAALIGDVRKIDFYIKWFLIGFIGYLIKVIFYNIALSKSHKSAYSLLEEIRLKILKKLPKLSLGKVVDTPSGKIKQIIVDQVESLERPVAHLIPELTANIIGPILILIYLFILDWRMALLSLVSFPIGMIFMKKIMKGYPKQFAGAVQVGGEMNSSIVEYIEGIEVIKAFNQGDEQYRKFSEKIKANANYYCKWMKDVQFLMSMSKSVMPTTLLAVLPVGWIFFKNGNLQAETFLMVIILAFSISGLLTEAMNFVDSLARVGTILDSVDSIILEEEQDHASKEFMLKNLDIELNDLRFSYNNEDEVIKGISMYLKEGSFNAFVGPSGGGKSTLAKLIGAYYDPSQGEIKLGNVEYKNIPLKQIYNYISYVSQDNFLFDESIRENIRMGKLGASDAEVEKVAKESGCHEFITNLEKGYDTKVGSGGGHLSSGERQRIAIARAMLKNAPIVILDEATAYIDPENERLVQKAIFKLLDGKTVIVIAHRLSTIKDSDQIYVIKDGKLDSQGRHKELLEKSSLYKDMWLAHIGAKEVIEND
ncbi:ABC transporter ATP-binding protein [Peptoniphilus sp. SGI.035]|uniref:ABC transporter ATP-binding protein n=1 Tax=Peptoniphilus sp. SGI.035 TaxID=3420564 RepID=UPI003D087D35